MSTTGQLTKVELPEYELRTWFENVPVTEWFEVTHVCQERALLNGWKRSFLYNMGIIASKGDVASDKQLPVAKRLYDEVKAAMKAR